MNKNKVIHTWNYKDGRIGVIYETPEGKVEEQTVRYNWYFTVERTNSDKANTILKNANGVYSIENDPKFPDFTKIYCPFKEQRSDILLLLEKNKIETFEGDLLEDKRWYVDKEIEISSNYKKLYFDIETDDSQGRIEIGRDRILSFAAIDNEGKKYYHVIKDLTDEEEKKMLVKFWKIVEKYNIVIGFNSHRFDVPYIKERSKKYGIKTYAWRKLAHIDICKRMLHTFRFDSKIKSFTLDYLCKYFLGKGKIEHSELVIELWKDNPQKLKDYNIMDILLLKELDEEIGVVEMIIRQCQWCGVPVSQFGLYSIIDTYILKTAHRVGKFCKTSVTALLERDPDNERGNLNPDDVDTDKNKYIGGAVLIPVAGRYKNVYTFDFKGLYPSVMRTSNIGYDTIRDTIGKDTIINPGTATLARQNKFVRPTYFEKELSVINLAISDLIEKRNEYKNLKLKMVEEKVNSGPKWERVVSDEIIVKELANSTYGIMGLSYGRYFSIDVAESITLFGQWCLRFARRFFKEKGHIVIYGDTDSIFVSTDTQKINVGTILREFHEKLTMELMTKYNIDKHYIQLNFDKQYDSFLLIAKKNYVGHVVSIEGHDADEIYTRGLQLIKKDTFRFAAAKQRELVEKLLLENYNANQTRDLVYDFRVEFDNKEFTKEELTIVKRVGRELEDYKNQKGLPHVRLAVELHKKTGERMKGKDIEYIVVSNEGGTVGILASEYRGRFDRSYYWNNSTLPLLERITEVAFPGEDIYGLTPSLFG